ncbi:MAG: ABC transporter permease [Dehalococcoidia bacterium]
MKSRISLRDLLGETLAGLFARPGRTFLTVLGTVIGIAALVATLGLSRTAGNRIVGRFDLLAATQVILEPATQSVLGTNAGIRLPLDSEARIARLNGVTRAGAFGDVDAGGSGVRPGHGVDLADAEPIRMVAASPGLLAAVRGRLDAGRFFDDGHSSRSDRVVVLGSGAAERLGIRTLDHQPAIYIGHDLYTVVGVLGAVERQPELLDAIIMPVGTASARLSFQGFSRLIVETEIGAARTIAAQGPIALNPNDPAAVRASAPDEPRRVKDQVAQDLNLLFVGLGVLALIAGAIGIANVTLVTVLERTAEIGLRRALGATRTHIAEQFLLESTAMGLAGGICGASAGTLVVVATAAARGWTPIIEPWIPLGAPFVGAVVGLVAGIYPALRGAALEPIDALRTG